MNADHDTTVDEPQVLERRPGEPYDFPAPPAELMAELRRLLPPVAVPTRDRFRRAS